MAVDVRVKFGPFTKANPDSNTTFIHLFIYFFHFNQAGLVADKCSEAQAEMNHEINSHGMLIIRSILDQKNTVLHISS